MQDFESFFRAATEHSPHGYQARIARDGLPNVVKAPTGTGKTGVILAWLWRRLYGPDPSGTPRRLSTRCRSDRWSTRSQERRASGSPTWDSRMMSHSTW